jgi:hypothetical protein
MSLKSNELKDSVKSSVHIDEYSAKMGDDSDILVLSFKVSYKDQASDLVNWFEKGYEWILDADVSAGELEDGGYLVFIEALRRPTIPNKILKLLDDMANLTDLKPEDYRLQYHKEISYVPLSMETITNKVPLEPRKYKKMHKSQDDVELENMQMAAGLAPKTEETTDPEIKAFVNLSK